MKVIFTLLLALLALGAQAQKTERLGFARLPVDSTTHLVTYTAVVPVEGANSEQLCLDVRKSGQLARKT